MSRIHYWALLVVAASPAVYGQCEPSLSVRKILEDTWSATTDHRPFEQGRALRRKAYLEALESHPHDYFLLRMALISTDEKDQQSEWAKAMRAKYPDKPVYELIYAQALIGRDTPAAIRILQSLATAHPELSRAHLVLAQNVYSYGKFKDMPKAAAELAEFVKACPAPLDTAPLTAVAQLGTKAQMAAVAAAVRKRIVEAPDSLMPGVWQPLWRLEFKVRPPAEHEALREQIRKDLARLENVPGRNELRWMIMLRDGYESAGDAAAVKRMKEEIGTKYPSSSAAKTEIQDRWRKAHEYPRNGSQAQLQAYRRALVAQYTQWHKAWPDDSMFYSQLFSAAIQLPETKREDVARMGDELVAAYRKDPSWYGATPVELQVADAFVKYKVSLDKVPALVEEGIARAAKRRREELADDQLPDELRTVIEQGNDSLIMERARVLLGYYAAVKQNDYAKLIESELAALHPVKPAQKAMLIERRAQAAEVLGRKLDALITYRAALDVRPPRPAGPDGDTLKQNIDRLWKELGGTPEAYTLFVSKPKPAEATDSRWELPKNPLPAFTASDLQGKVWRLASLEGKVVLINVWATWCGPCRAEHPEFQKLYDKLKDRPDVSVISFNIDDDVGRVAPYMKENGYMFPVLLARDVVDQVLPLIAIPQNWFVDAKGKLRGSRLGTATIPGGNAECSRNSTKS